MHITIAAVGRMSSEPEKLLWEKYFCRIKWPLTLREVEEKKPLKKQQLLQREYELLAKVVPHRALLVALDKSGSPSSSTDFAQLFQDWSTNNQREVTFVLGGTNGLANSLLTQANLKLSMGNQTWPHMLARCMLIEQIYRAQCILTNHPYHR